MLPGFLASLLCRVIVIPRGESHIHVSPFPAGTCALCCPIQLERDVEFLLYTRRNPTLGDTLSLGSTRSLRKSKFNSRNPSIIYIHGYSESAPGLSGTTIRDGFCTEDPGTGCFWCVDDRFVLLPKAKPNGKFLCDFPLRAYLSRGDYNIILVNWAKLSALPWYITAVENTRLVGPYVSAMVAWLDAIRAVPLSRIHVIGFSLGAEAAGFMGKALKPRKVGRITGLDAAYPLYMNTGAQGHLTSADANFVDVIHTDGGILGFPNPLGHADFYPNGGRPLQPGCNLENIIRMGITRLINQYIVCGHNRAWKFYAESVVNPTGFPASRCPKWRPDIRANCVWTPDAFMGFAANPGTRGMFYLSTNAQPPYARNTSGYVG